MSNPNTPAPGFKQNPTQLGGIRQPKELNQREQINELYKAVNQLRDQRDRDAKSIADQLNKVMNEAVTGISQRVGFAMNSLRNDIMARVSEQIGGIDYRMVALTSLLDEKGTVSRADIETRERDLKIKDFDDTIRSETESMRATQAPEGQPVKEGDLVVFTSSTKHCATLRDQEGKDQPNPYAGEEFVPYTILRSRLIVGDKRFPFVPPFQTQFVGMTANQTKTFTFEVAPGVSVESTIQVLSVYELPKPVQAPAANPGPTTTTDAPAPPPQAAAPVVTDPVMKAADFAKLAEPAPVAPAVPETPAQ